MPGMRTQLFGSFLPRQDQMHSPIKYAGMAVLAAAFTPLLSAQPPKLPDTELVDQDGHSVHFYSDLVRGHTVAINFIFTNCQTICPLLGATFGKLNRLLAKDSGFQLISISIDPENDTPARLREYAAKFGPSPSWRLLTGDKGHVTELLRALGAYSPDKNAHSGEVLIGNGQEAWIRGNGLGSPAALAELMRKVH
jgi:protein SCO1